MDAVSDETIHRAGEGLHPGDGELRSLKPNRDHWRAVMIDPAAGASLPMWPRWSGAGGLAGIAGTAALALLAGARPDLGGYEVVALLPALAAACAPAALCLRFAAASRGLPGAEDRRAASPGPDARTNPVRRRHARIKPRQTRTFVATEDGRRLNALIIDVSQSGVAVEGNLPGLWVGAMATVGSRRAKAVRALPHGMAFEFSLPVSPEALTVDLVL